MTEITYISQIQQQKNSHSFIGSHTVK